MVGIEPGVKWEVMGAVSDILTALAFLSIFLAITLVAARREVGKYRGGLIFFAFFVFCAGVNQVLNLTPWIGAQGWWNLLTAILSVLAATVIIANLPHYLRMPKIAEELRGQAGFLEEQQTLLQAI